MLIDTFKNKIVHTIGGMSVADWALEMVRSPVLNLDYKVSQSIDLIR